jgi:SAM-dependent methyltransferase
MSRPSTGAAEAPSVAPVSAEPWFKRVVVERALPTLRSKVRPQEFKLARAHSLSRWVETSPTAGLTLGVELTGDTFVDFLGRHFAFDSDSRLLEIGPGYGRILHSLIDRGLPFHSYLGLDLSARNVAYLGAAVTNRRVRFERGDVDSFAGNDRFDLVFASLTFQHFYPTFERHLANLLPRLSPNGVVAFDLLERRWFYPFAEYFEVKGGATTYVRVYRPGELGRLSRRAGGRLVALDSVELLPGRSNLGVVVGAVDRQGSARPWGGREPDSLPERSPHDG